MKLNILLIEDDRSVRLTLAYILQALNHDVAEAESIEMAKEYLASTKFDLVICDQNLWDGYLGTNLLTEFAQTYPGMQRMLMSGSRDPGGYTAAFLRKPFSLPEVQAKLESMFQTTPP